LHEIGEEIIQALSYDHEIEVIVGTKMDKDTMWFYVRFDDNSFSFIPSQILNKIAPEKVISYYENILTFSSQHADLPQGKDTIQKRVSDTIMDRKISTAVETKRQKEKEKQKQNGSKSKQPVQTVKRSSMKCQNCSTLLQFPETAKLIKCPVCLAIMQAQFSNL